MRDTPALLRQLVHMVTTDPRVLTLAFHARVCFVLFSALAYILLPFDLLPEAVLGLLGLVLSLAIFLVFHNLILISIGRLIDDVLFVFLMVVLLAQVTRSMLRNQ